MYHCILLKYNYYLNLCLLIELQLFINIKLLFNFQILVDCSLYINSKKKNRKLLCITVSLCITIVIITFVSILKHNYL